MHHPNFFHSWLNNPYPFFNTHLCVGKQPAAARESSPLTELDSPVKPKTLSTRDKIQARRKLEDIAEPEDDSSPEVPMDVSDVEIDSANKATARKGKKDLGPDGRCALIISDSRIWCAYKIFNS